MGLGGKASVVNPPGLSTDARQCGAVGNWRTAVGGCPQARPVGRPVVHGGDLKQLHPPAPCYTQGEKHPVYREREGPRSRPWDCRGRFATGGGSMGFVAFAGGVAASSSCRFRLEVSKRLLTTV